MMKFTACRHWTLVLTLLAIASMSAYAQPGGGGRGGGRQGGGRAGGGFFGGFGSTGTNDVNFAMRADVQEELDLSDSQISELRDIQGDMPNMFRMAQDEGIDFRSMRDMSQEEREEAMAPIVKKIAKANEDAQDNLMDVLKTSQKARFKELKFQYEFSQGDLVNALKSAEVEIDDDEEEELEDARRDVQEKLNKRIAEIRKELYMEALAGAGLSSSKIEKLMGDSFEFTSGRGGAAFGGRQGGGGGARGGGNARQGRQRGGGEDGGDRNQRRRRGSDSEGEDDNPRRSRRPN